MGDLGQQGVEEFIAGIKKQIAERT
jgi:hypothetical protein